MNPVGVLLSRVVILAALVLLSSDAVFADRVGMRHAVSPPEPFSLNGYDSIQAISVLRRAGLIRVLDDDGRPRTVAVREVHAVLIGVDEHAAPAYRLRYDVILNGEPLAWDKTYVEYGGRMVNMRLLFTYRNQVPPSSVPFHIE